MEPSTNPERGAINLPSPVPQAGLENMPKANNESARESHASYPENAPAAAFVAASSLPQLTVPTTQQDKTQLNTSVSNTTTTAVPITADDSDLIEKEWVTKAKKIVDSDREDPYKQSKDLTVFKADYMKKRYNKIIKLSE